MTVYIQIHIGIICAWAFDLQCDNAYLLIWAVILKIILCREIILIRVIITGISVLWNRNMIRLVWIWNIVAYRNIIFIACYTWFIEYEIHIENIGCWIEIILNCAFERECIRHCTFAETLLWNIRIINPLCLAEIISVGWECGIGDKNNSRQ